VYEDLSGFDFLYVSGGLGTVPLMDNKRAIDYLKTWGDERPLASVCSGALLLGRARVKIAAQMEYRGYSEE
jgi:cyclohexyl-isocyanide hydratase